MKLKFLENGGIMRTSHAKQLGITKEHLSLLVDLGELEKAAFGVYILPDEFADKMYVTHLRRSKIIYSHETALYLHDLTDRDPLSYCLTVPTGYNTKTLKESGFKVFSIKKELHEIGKIELETVFGNKVRAYDMERTICDCLRSRNQMDIEIVSEAIKRYVKRKDKNLPKLMDMAELFYVQRLLRSYLEVLL